MNSTIDEQCGCADFVLSRRSILKGATALGGALAVTQMFGDAMMQSTFAGTPGGNTLVVLSLRGGIDGLGVVVPHGDPGYYAARPTTAVPASSLLCADAMFGLHPSMAPLQRFWNSGEIAAIQATGLPNANRSHFSAIAEVEDAAPGSSQRSGWINRMIGMGSSPTLLDGVQIGSNSPTAAISGEAASVTTKDVNKMQVPGIGGWASERYSSLQTAWGAVQGPLATGFGQAITVSKGPGQKVATMAATATPYPTSSNAAPFAESLKNAARLIKADVGTDVIAIDGGNWDLHTNYGNLTAGAMQGSISGLAQSLAAFLDDLGELRQRVTVVTISEFGRRVAENGSQGFDHGWGNMMLVAGAGVRGGRYYGNWPGLNSTALGDGDLKVTTDYRNVLGEIVSKRFPDRSLPDLFPGISYNPTGFML